MKARLCIMSALIIITAKYAIGESITGMVNDVFMEDELDSAKVIVTNKTTEISDTIFSDSTGYFSISNLTSGYYYFSKTAGAKSSGNRS
jgi:hypothetical protein